MAATVTASMSGNVGALGVFGARVSRVGSNATLRGLAKELGNAGLFEVQAGFSTHTDPYGDPWKPKVIPDGNPILVGKTGKLRVGWYLKYVGPDAVIIGNRTREAGFQSGTGVYGPTGQPIRPKTKKALSFKGPGGRFTFRSVRGAPPRLMVPRQGEMPPAWNRALTVAAREYMMARLNGG